MSDPRRVGGFGELLRCERNGRCPEGVAEQVHTRRVGAGEDALRERVGGAVCRRRRRALAEEHVRDRAPYLPNDIREHARLARSRAEPGRRRKCIFAPSNI